MSAPDNPPAFPCPFNVGDLVRHKSGSGTSVQIVATRWEAQGSARGGHWWLFFDERNEGYPAKHYELAQ
jgi:hypothetical protein